MCNNAQHLVLQVPTAAQSVAQFRAGKRHVVAVLAPIPASGPWPGGSNPSAGTPCPQPRWFGLAAGSAGLLQLPIVRSSCGIPFSSLLQATNQLFDSVRPALRSVSSCDRAAPVAKRLPGCLLSARAGSADGIPYRVASDRVSHRRAADSPLLSKTENSSRLCADSRTVCKTVLDRELRFSPRAVREGPRRPNGRGVPGFGGRSVVKSWPNMGILGRFRAIAPPVVPQRRLRSDSLYRWTAGVHWCCLRWSVAGKSGRTAVDRGMAVCRRAPGPTN